MRSVWMVARLGLVVGTAAGFHAATHPSFAQEGPPGLTRPVPLPPFNPDDPACTAPPGLQRVLAFAQDNQRQFMI
jgi:ribose transport system substrate-binding protein